MIYLWILIAGRWDTGVAGYGRLVADNSRSRTQSGDTQRMHRGVMYACPSNCIDDTKNQVAIFITEDGTTSSYVGAAQRYT